MKAVKLWMLAVILTIYGAMSTMLTSCSDVIDNPATPAPAPLNDKLVGQWLAMEEAEAGRYGIAGNLYEITFVTLQEDGRGSYLFFVVNEDREVIERDDMQQACAFNFTTTADGDAIISARETTNDLKLENDLTLSFKDDVLKADDGEHIRTMHHPNRLEEMQLTLWWEALEFGGGPEAAYNINDPDFNATNWRSQKVIYMYDGKGEHVDENNHRFTAVQLPWSNDVVESNLPLHFCDDVTPEQGWELVMNYCGSTISSNNNFFALYNKYTGILRFFTYIPLDMNVSNASDHAWNVLLTEDIAQHLGMRYGLPMDQKIVNKVALGMTGTDYNVVVSPWVASLSNDKYTTPAPGWWAFDLDLSAYRPEFTPLTEQIRLQMCAWSKGDITLTSTVKMQIKQEVPATTYSLNSLSGLVGLTDDARSSVFDLVGKISGGQWFDAFKSGIDFAKLGYNVFTSARDMNNKPSMKVLQHVDGTISTSGMISQSVAVAGVRNPTFPMSKFETSKSTLGQGVWNLRSAPVLYQIDGYFHYYRNYDPEVYVEPLTLFDKDRADYNLCFPVIFDPSSVVVELNPNVFPKDDIEYMDVQSFCGVRKDTNHDTNNSYRQAFGMDRNEKFELSKDALVITENHQYNNPVYDCLFDSGDKMGLEYPTRYEEYERSGDLITRLVGRGDPEFLLEPQTFKSTDSRYHEIDNVLPCYEVFVTVIVKTKNNPEPYIYTRTYIPEIRLLNLANAKSVVSKMTRYIEHVKKDTKPSATEGTKLLEMQLQHMKSFFAFMKSDYDTAIEGVTYSIVRGGGGYAEKLFDGNLKSSWDASISARENGSQWEVEFKASKPIAPKKYTIVTDANWEEYKECNPTQWKIYGKDAKGNWCKLDERYTPNSPQDALPDGNSASKTYTIQNPGTYQEFQFVIVNYAGSLSGFYAFWHPATTRCRVAELRFED